MSDNKRIAKNTLFLYLRMLFIMAVGLYVTRAVLNLLGVVDYGIYNVVGGLVAMFSFLQGSLTTSSQRYFSIELAKGDAESLNKWFCYNITIYLVLAGVVILICEMVGLWFLNTQMVIPQERLFSANVVYQLSIISFCFSLFSIPYNALIVSHEKMSAFAYIGMFEATYRLLIVAILSIITWDKLIIYGGLMLISSFLVLAAYMTYCLQHFKESKYRFLWDKQRIKELFSFTGWHFLGTISVAFRSYGINILINMFFSPAINAARAISYQVSSAVQQLDSNFFLAVKPQIYKSYASNKISELHRLCLRSSIVCVFLVSILAYPVLANTTYLLGLWLKDVPSYAVLFTQLVLLNSIIDATGNPVYASVLATGTIKNFQIVVSILNLLTIPLSYIALKLGAEPTVTVIVSIFVSAISVFVRALFLEKQIGLRITRYLTVIGKLVGANLLIGAVIYFFMYNVAESFVSMLIVSVLIVVIITMVYITFVFDKNDIKTVYRMLVNKIRKL